MKELKMPRHVDQSKQVLLWSFDELMPILMAIVFGVVIEQVFICTAIGFALARFYRRFKETRPDGYMVHMLYWYGMYFPPARSIVQSFRRHFLG